VVKKVANRLPIQRPLCILLLALYRTFQLVQGSGSTHLYLPSRYLRQEDLPASEMEGDTGRYRTTTTTIGCISPTVYSHEPSHYLGYTCLVLYSLNLIFRLEVGRLFGKT
jgi:hypothetical protein